MDISSDLFVSKFKECVLNELSLKINKICVGEGLDFNEIKEKYLNGIDLNTECTIRKKRILKNPPPEKRCIAYNADMEQCKRSRKDGTDFCRRHVKKQTNGTIFDKKKDTVEPVAEIDDDNIDNVYDGNIIEIDGVEYIHIPSSNLIYNFDPQDMKKLGYLDDKNNKIIYQNFD
tara:strand:- start:361 stop:882 length:522 start_codon:yes stop_codon:yes gene_type:complete